MDELYVLARRVLLDALEAMGPHRQACILVGAQAIYLRVGEADLAVAPYTTDGDLVLDPRLLSNAPPIERGLLDAGFALKGGGSVGIWITQRATSINPELEVAVDIMVPEAISHREGRRAARLDGHDPNAARVARGLEGALFDADLMRVNALDQADARSIEIRAAGPAALLVSKLHKINDRLGSNRSDDKDAFDVLRLLRGTTAEVMAARVRRLRDEPLSRLVTLEAVELLDSLFGRPDGNGSQMAVRASRGLADPAEIAASCAALSEDVLKAVGH